MHVPDHLIDRPVELAAGVGAAAVIVAVALHTRDRDDGPTVLRAPQRLAPQAATAALVFALQMVNVPVLPGTSGHLLGGALATALVGPRRALLAVSAVVVTQALLFADGGVAAMGVNLWLIAVLPVATAAAVRHVLAVRSTTGARWWCSVALGALLGPVVSAAAFSVVFALGGTGAAPVELAGAMLSTHAAIAVAEALITLAVVALVAAAVEWTDSTAAVWGLAGAAALGLSLAASSAPDGLERVLGDLQVAVGGPGSILSSSPFADYTAVGLQGPLATVAAGGAGLVAVVAVVAVLCGALRGGEIAPLATEVRPSR